MLLQEKQRKAVTWAARIFNHIDVFAWSLVPEVDECRMLLERAFDTNDDQPPSELLAPALAAFRRLPWEMRSDISCGFAPIARQIDPARCGMGAEAKELRRELAIL